MTTKQTTDRRRASSVPAARASPWRSDCRSTASPYDCFEMSDDIGGNWYFRNPNGARRATEPAHRHLEVAVGLRGLPGARGLARLPAPRTAAAVLPRLRRPLRPARRRSRSTPASPDCQRLDDGRWDVTLSTGETRTYDNLIVANGHHWDARMPTTRASFDGYQVHSHHYRDPFDPYDFRGKRVMVVGVGNSAMDISSELSQRPIAEALFISMRRGVWVMPKYIDGHARRQGGAAEVDAGEGRSRARPQEDREDDRESRGLRAAEARPPSARRAPVGVGEFLSGRIRGHLPERGHRASRRRSSGVHRRVTSSGSTRSCGRPATT